MGIRARSTISLITARDRATPPTPEPEQASASILANSSSYNQAFNIVLLRYGFEFINDTAG